MRVADSLDRPLRALRVSVTDRCNFRCTYCMPREHFGDLHPFLDRAEILTFEEIERVVRIFVELGVEKVRLTGGEPLLRHELPALVHRLRTIAGLRELTLTTNGTLLGDFAKPLREAGLDRITVSLDSLDPERFAALTDSRVPLERVLAGIQAAQAAGFAPLKLNCVLQRGSNEADILPLAAFAREHGHILRFIEFMDVGTGNGWRLDRVIPAAEVARILASRWPLEPYHRECTNCVAQHWRYLDGRGEVGLIASVTEPFCQGCDRARLSAEGSLYTCLFAGEGLDLKTFLRAGASDADVKALVEARWRRREDRYSELRTAATSQRPKIEMFQIGG
jgi:cyclic pyranopterin phosphate synthase